MGLGCRGMSANYGRPGDKQGMIALIRRAFKRGVTFFDTAEFYGPFVNKELIRQPLVPVGSQACDRDKVRLRLQPDDQRSAPVALMVVTNISQPLRTPLSSILAWRCYLSMDAWHS